MADTLPRLLQEADLVRRICRQMCIYDDVDPDESMGLEPPYERFVNWEYHVANVNAVLRALRDISS